MVSRIQGQGMKPGCEVPKLYAVVDLFDQHIIARGLPMAAAVGTKRAWEITDGPAELVEEELDWPSADQVRARLKVAR
jgi:hypothetical protein